MENRFRVLGAMSGTSCDGLDLALVDLWYDLRQWHFQWVATKTIKYDASQQAFLRQLNQLNAVDLIEVDRSWGRWMGKQIKAFLADKGKVDFIASHGHTVFHQPMKGYTFQLGHGGSMAIEAGLPVICDFRSNDVALGGQGAPLVPIGDALLFPNYSFCLNLGGFANVSYQIKERLAFDVCPLNLPLNRIAQLLGAEYDAGGHWARSGSVNDQLLSQLNALEYYQQAPPKSLGVEWLNSHFYPLCAQVELDGPDFLRTLTEHMAWQVARIFEGWAGEVLVTGGGAYNTFLLEQIQSKTNLKLVIPDSQTVEFKEALIFALLGVLRYNAIPNALASVTGASRDSVNGAIYLP